MNIQGIINGKDNQKLLSEILGRIHSEGPVLPKDIESISYIKKFQPDFFASYESKLIALMGLFYKTQDPESVLETIYNMFSQSIEQEIGKKFTPVQADVYRKIVNTTYFSFSAPTSAGKSFLFREMIKEESGDIVIIVPSRALVSEYIHKITKIVDKSVLVLQFIEVLNIKNTHRRIYVITPERGAELFKNLPRLNIKLVLFDEAQLSEDGIRGMRFDSFVRRVDRLIPNAKKVFTHPFIDNPEAQLEKHNFTEDADSKSYKQNSVGKIFLSYKDSKYKYFSPFELRSIKIKTDDDIVEQTLLNEGTVLIYVSKTKIYNGNFKSEFSKYINLCRPLTNQQALSYIDRLREFIGASKTDQDKYSVLIEMMEKGVVVHHGSIPLKARLIIEEFVNKNFARICFSTSTLIQGINMPFDVVWINNFTFRGTEDQKILDLKNLIGRAGRSTDRINSFDFGYVVIEERNISKFKKRLVSPSAISNSSKLDEETEALDEDQLDMVEAIKEDTFDDELQLTDSQVDRLKNAEIDSDIEYILEKLIPNGIVINGSQYYKELTSTERKKVKEAFKTVYVSHLRRNYLNKAEFSVLSAAIPILLWQIQGKSFSEIISLRYAFLSEKDLRRVLAQEERRGLRTSSEVHEEIAKLKIRYSPQAQPLPNSKLVALGLYPLNALVSQLEYDTVVYDTYDYIDKVLSFSLREPLSAAFLIYFEKTGDRRAIQLSNYIKYGTDDRLEIWLIRYGFSFDDIEWIKGYVRRIDENEIIFDQTINQLTEEKLKVIERFI